MNILICSWRGPGHPLAGGAEQASSTHTAAWVKAGHRVWLFTSAVQGLPHREKISGINIIRRGNQFPGVQLAACWWYLFSAHPRFDLVVDEFHGAPFFTPLYVRTPILGFIHEIAGSVWRYNPWQGLWHWLPRIFGRLGEPLIFRWFYSRYPFMTVSQSTAADLRNFGIKQITVVPNGLTTPLRKPAIKRHHPPAILYLSALAPDKGIEEAIAAFRIFHPRFPDWQFWVAGYSTPEYLNYLQNLTRDLPVNFLGFVTDSVKFKLYASASIFINPSFHEGWGLVNIEAGAFALPVVGYRVGGVRDSVLDGITGLLAPVHQPRQLADNLSRLAADISLRQSLGQAGKLHSRKFSWHASTQLSLQLIHNIHSHYGR